MSLRGSNSNLSRPLRRAGLAAAVMAGVLGVVSAPDAIASAQSSVGGAASRDMRPDVVAAVPVAPHTAKLIGSLAPAARLSADVVLRPHNPSELAQVASEVSTPGSPSRGDYLTQRQLRQAFSPTRAEVGAVSAGLRSRGLTVGAVSADRFTIHVSGSAAVVARALGTRFVTYKMASGRVAFANATPALLPAWIGSSVQSVIGLSDVSRFHALGLHGSHHSTSQTTTNSSTPARSSSPAVTSHTSGPTPCAEASDFDDTGAYTADELAKAYGMDGLYSDGDLGKGVTIGIYELEKDSTSDISAYERCYGISTKVTYKKVDGGAKGSAAGSGEAALDIEDIAGLAPRANLDVFQAPNSASGPYDNIQAIVEDSKVHVVSTSWGECEYLMGRSRAAALSVGNAESTQFELAAAEGQAWMAAAGDDGSTDCPDLEDPNLLSVDDPGAEPYVTSVGGTKLLDADATPSQSVWNESAVANGAGGGGISALWGMPPYQSEAPSSLKVVNDKSSKKPCQVKGRLCREVPDVSADADPHTGYIIHWGGGWGVIGGTSAAAPLWAAVTALTDASSECKGASVGFLNPSLYSIAGSKAYASSFTDITVGNNDYTPDGYSGGDY